MAVFFENLQILSLLVEISRQSVVLALTPPTRFTEGFFTRRPHACCRHYPRRSGWAYCFAHSLSRISLPRYGSRVCLRIVLSEACSAFTRVTACTLALSPYIVPEAATALNSYLPNIARSKNRVPYNRNSRCR